MTKLTKNFGSKEYRVFSSFNNKSNAIYHANNLRKEGNYARITQKVWKSSYHKTALKMYLVWWRRKSK